MRCTAIVTPRGRYDIENLPGVGQIMIPTQGERINTRYLVLGMTQGSALEVRGEMQPHLDGRRVSWDELPKLLNQNGGISIGKRVVGRRVDAQNHPVPIDGANDYILTTAITGFEY